MTLLSFNSGKTLKDQLSATWGFFLLFLKGMFHLSSFSLSILIWLEDRQHLLKTVNSIIFSKGSPEEKNKQTKPTKNTKQKKTQTTETTENKINIIMWNWRYQQSIFLLRYDPYCEKVWFLLPIHYAKSFLRSMLPIHSYWPIGDGITKGLTDKSTSFSYLS